MQYRVRVMVENVESGSSREAERTVTLDAGSFEMGGKLTKRPIDTAQQERLVSWAVNEATDEVIGRR